MVLDATQTLIEYLHEHVGFILLAPTQKNIPQKGD